MAGKITIINPLEGDEDIELKTSRPAIEVTEEDGREVKTAIQKAGSATLRDLNSYSEVEGALAMIRATSVDARHYLAIQKQIEAAAIKIYREGWDDGSGFVLEAIRVEDRENEPRS